MAVYEQARLKGFSKKVMVMSSRISVIRKG